MLRKLRIIIALFFFTFITLLFLDFTGFFHHWFGWMAKVQFFPALQALNFMVLIVLAGVTLFFGRIYCSTICPLGVFQDGISTIASKRNKNRFSYSPAVSWLRYGMLAVFIAGIIISFTAGAGVIVSLLEPYSAYGRIASSFFAPLYRGGNNLLAYFAERADSYAFYQTDIWFKSTFVFGIALVTFVIIFILAWRNGRTYCNTICPVGTFLGFISRFSLFKPVFEPSKCNGCGLCARNCKAACIDAKTREIDYSRCVTCMNCIDKCKKNAIKYTIQLKSQKNETKNTQAETNEPLTDTSRRNFFIITGSFALSSALKAQEKIGDGGLAAIEDKRIPNRMVPVLPPGSVSARNLSRHCTACQLCISACPNQVLRPSGNMMTIMQPEMSFERGFCRPECTRCSEVCPTAAIRRIGTAEKSALQVGRAIWIKENCVVTRDDVNCNSCERHCPVGAIQRVDIDPDNPESLKIPAIDTERCIGCGACENLCPARPFSAIYVEGNERQKTV